MDATHKDKRDLEKLEKRIVQESLSELQSALQKLYGDDAPTILVFGSHARGEASTASDIDVLLLFPMAVEPGQEIQRISSTLAELNLRYQVLISILPASEEEYRNSTGMFWQNLRQEGVPIEAI